MADRPDALEWERFRAGVPEAGRDGALADAYRRLLIDPDPAVHEQAARDWCAMDVAIVAATDAFALIG